MYTTIITILKLQNGKPYTRRLGSSNRQRTTQQDAGMVNTIQTRPSLISNEVPGLGTISIPDNEKEPEDVVQHTHSEEPSSE